MRHSGFAFRPRTLLLQETIQHSPAFYARYKELVIQFRDEIKKKTFPTKLEDWWRYEYEVRESGASLRVSHIEYFNFGRSDIVDEDIDTTSPTVHSSLLPDPSRNGKLP